AGAGLRNYPNPFTGATTVEVTTQHVARATLAIYSLSGAMIRVLHSGALSDGNHRFSFDAGHLPGGIYVVRFVMESDSQSLKISLR
ncbi:MAG TPA: T9SS type A sorting domain-containing protein, partial [Prolixibacteraceae bacterium]|nr:T9SS type A sorting domain-containing protein [Prolixibacteraceae bacterium]